MTDSNGMVTLKVTSGPKVGRWKVWVTAKGVGEPVELTIDNVAAAPVAAAVLHGDSQRAVVANAFPDPVVVRFTDRFGNPTPGAAIDVSTIPYNALVAPTSVTTDAAGEARLTVAAGTRVPASLQWLGDFNKAQVGFGPVGPFGPLPFGKVALFVFPDVAVDSSVAVDDAEVAVNEFGGYIRVRALDRFGNDVEGIAVTLESIAGPSGASGEVTPSTTFTSVHDDIRGSYTANAIVGTWTLRITAAGLGTHDLTITNLANP